MATINNYDIVYDRCTTSIEMLERLKGEVFENMNQEDPFKEYLLNELARVQRMVMDTQMAFNDGYCLDPQEKSFNEKKLSDKINSINDEIDRNGLSL